jgi:hypothetical protein
MLNDGDVVQIGQHEIMYFDDRMARTRVPLGEEDDAVPLLHDVMQGDRGRPAGGDEDEVLPIPPRQTQAT